MGKTNNLFTGIVRKKVGSLVGYRITNSNNGEKQGLRTYVANPKNPKSLAQAIQRCKLGPASRFYRAFSIILDHAFEGVEIGTPSRSHFMSLAMLSNSPASPKGDTTIPVFPYIVARGSMPVSPFNSVAADVITIGAVGHNSADETWGTMNVSTFTQEVLASNPTLQDGDEVTFMGVIAPVSGSVVGTPIPVYKSLVLNLGDDTIMTNALASPFLTFTDGATGLSVTAATGYKLLAGTFIMSRRNGSAWQYTPAEMIVTNSGADFYNEDNVEQAVRSYMEKSASASSALILQQANNGVASAEWVLTDDGYVVLKNTDGRNVRIARGKTTSGAMYWVKVTGVGTSELTSDEDTPAGYRSLPQTLFDNPRQFTLATGVNVGSSTSAWDDPEGEIPRP